MKKIGLFIAITIVILSSACKSKHHKQPTQAEMDTIRTQIDNKVMPYDDSATWHYQMARRYYYLRDTVAAKNEVAAMKYWDHKADSIIAKYHIRKFVKEYYHAD